MPATGTIEVVVTGDTSQIQDDLEELQLKIDTITAKGERSREKAYARLSAYYARKAAQAAERVADLYPRWHPRHWLAKLAVRRWERETGETL